MALRFWGAVAKDGSHIRGVELAENLENAHAVLFNGWTERLQALYDVRPVTVAVDVAAESAMSSEARAAPKDD